MYRKNFPGYTFLIFIFFLSCTKESGIIDPPLYETSAIITGVRLSEYLIDSDTLSLVPGRDRYPDDPVKLIIGIEVSIHSRNGTLPQSVSSTLSLDDATQALSTTPLKKINDTTYSVVLQQQIARGDVGDYKVAVDGIDAEGRTMNSGVAKFRVFYGATPDTLSDLIMVDTLTLPLPGDSTIIPIQILVTDHGGKKNVKRVFFNMYLPDGSPSSANPLDMYDDGGSIHPLDGDAIAGDGIYSLKIVLPSTAKKGKYRLEFHAVNYSNLPSNVIIRYFYVL
jgi:hypothetical protein